MTGADGGVGPGARPGWRWDVALSFAAAQRAYVEQVAQALQARGVRCFYDADEQIDLWGKYLAEALPVIYGEQAAAVVVFVSAEYAARDWTRYERRAALARAVRERREYVLPARFDDTPLPGLLSDMVTVDLRTRTPEQFAAMIAGKLAALGIAAPTPPADAGDAARDVEAAPPAGAVRAGEADPRRLGLHAAISVPGVPEEVLPEYVPWDVDAAEFGVRARVGESAARDIERRRQQSSPRALLAAASILAVVIAGGVIAVLRYGLVAAIVVLLVVLVAGFRSIRIIPQAMAGIVERFGRYHRTLNPGLNVVVPFADRLRPLVDLRQQAVSFPPQQVLTKGNVIVGIDTIIYFHVTDVKAFIYENVNFFWALEQLTVSRLRILVSGMDVETTLASRDQINNELKRELSEAMGKWGIRIDRVELKAIERRP